MIFIRKPYETPKRDLSTRVRRAAVTIIFLSAGIPYFKIIIWKRYISTNFNYVVEHLLYLASAVVSQYRRTNLCATLQNSTVHFTFEEYAYKNYDYVYEIFPNTTLVGSLILVSGNFFLHAGSHKSPSHIIDMEHRKKDSENIHVLQTSLGLLFKLGDT